jgi:DNA modification methylase
MGSFTTAVACHKLGRHYIGAEKDSEYFEIGYKRLEEEINKPKYKKLDLEKHNLSVKKIIK